MNDPSDPQREAIHEAIQANSKAFHDRGGVLTGWVLVTEWMDEQGERWLTKGHAAAVPSWSANGFHHEALYGDWPDPDDE